MFCQKETIIVTEESCNYLNSVYDKEQRANPLLMALGKLHGSRVLPIEVIGKLLLSTLDRVAINWNQLDSAQGLFLKCQENS